MEQERKTELALAVHRLISHNLWRKGKMAESVSPIDIGDAIETVCGAALDYMSESVELDVLKKSIKSCEHALEQQEYITISTKKMLDDARAEIRRLKAILAAKHIKFRKNR